METEKYKPNPALGGEHIEARKKEVLDHLKKAVDVAYYHIDQQLEIDIENLRKKAGDQKSKMVGFVKKAEELPALTVVRKYWQKTDDDVLHHLTETIMRQGE
jgi:coenzyme F420-reducing hydrogenase alpha subunit